jgi:hypothetical protein
MLCAQPGQFAPDQRQRGALLGLQGAGIELFGPLQQLRGMLVTALVVGRGLTEQHGIGQRLACQHGRQGQCMALEGPVLLRQGGQRGPGLFHGVRGLIGHGLGSAGAPQMASRITAIVQSGSS